MKKTKVAALLAGLTSLSILLAGCESESGGDNASGSQPTDNCTQVSIATSPEKVNMMNKMGQVFKEQAKDYGDCFTITALSVNSGDAAVELSKASDKWSLTTNERLWPTMWSPASSFWTDRVKLSGGNKMLSENTSFVYTPMVFGMPEGMTDALNYPKKPLGIKDMEQIISAKDGWGSKGHPLWGEFKVSKTNPNSSTSGLSTILMQSYANAGKDKKLTVQDVDKAKSFSQSFEKGAIHYGDTTGQVLTQMYQKEGDGNNYVSAVAMEETSLINYNQGNPDSHTVAEGETLTPPQEKLVAVYPKEGSLTSDNPVTTLNAQWVTETQKEIANDFQKFLTGAEAQKLAPKYGFRPVDKKVDLGDLFSSKYGVQSKIPNKTLEKPSEAVVGQAIDQWEEIRKPSSVLQMIDLSGSMEEKTSEGKTKLDGAIRGVNSTLGNFRSNDKVGVWTFTTGISSSLGKNLYELREYDDLEGDGETIKKQMNSLPGAVKGGTPLYDAISEGYDYMSEHAEPGRINAVIVLTDGEDTDSQISLQSLLVKLNSDSQREGVEASKQVRVFPIAYGESADKDILTQIANASGGQVFDASDPTQLDRVFASVIRNF